VHVQDTDEVVERTAVDRVAGVLRLRHPREAFRGRQVDWDRVHFGSRHHHLAHLFICKVEDLVEHLLFRLLDHTRLLGLRDEKSDVLLCLDRDSGRRWCDPQGPGQEPGDGAEEPDNGAERKREQLEGERHSQRNPLASGECDRLRHELADGDVHEGEQGERE
jgi:hypothetical protein